MGHGSGLHTDHIAHTRRTYRIDDRGALMKRISGQFKLADDFMIVCNHRGAVLADKGIFNLGHVSVWLCTGCTARVREQVVTGILTDAAGLQFHVDGQLQQMIKENTQALNDAREAIERKK